MAQIEFHKMHGLGNDFVIIDTRKTAVDISASQIIALADRKSGIGCDQFILLAPSDIADVRMRIFNSDGGEVESCGNATRCVVALLGKDVQIETDGGLIEGRFGEHSISLEMPPPRFEWQDIPLAFAMDSAAMPLAWEQLATPMAVNVGNPHAVFFVDNAHAIDLERLGPLIEHDPAFPDRINVNVASIEDGAIRLRVWERGVGLTKACGTGACATAVAAIRQGKVTSPVDVHQAGGKLTIDWQHGAPILMTGGATYVFKGQLDWTAFA
jgi:diaminopimelate epimerase